MHIVVVPGTNRAGALSRTLATHVVADYQALGHSVDLLDLTDMGPEFLDPTVYKEQPATVRAMVERFVKADGVVFIVPEYNGSYPGVLKLFVDMLPYPQGFDQRPCAFIGLAAGQFAGLRAVEAFQAVAGYRMALQYPRRVFIAGSYGQFDGDGQLTDSDLRERVRAQAAGFTTFIDQVGGQQATSLD
ncbi:MAG: NADPH-dependent FMN reductase [Planctomycetota bacterium]|jgi:NAD(P)H-dependent FMN reductase